MRKEIKDFFDLDDPNGNIRAVMEIDEKMEQIESKFREINNLIKTLNNSALELITVSSQVEYKYRQLKHNPSNRLDKEYSQIESKINEVISKYKS